VVFPAFLGCRRSCAGCKSCSVAPGAHGTMGR
jgi:hypothetical protein